MFDGTKGDDARDLARFGYKQELVRTIGSFTAFCTGFAFISVMTGMFLLFGENYGLGGPAAIWAWMAAFGGQLLFAFVFAELAVRYPLQGSVYNWTKNIARHDATAWLAGASMILALMVSTAAVAITMQNVLPYISSVFWIYGNGHGAHDATVNGIILGSIMIALTTAICLLGARVRSFVNNLGVTVELLGSSFLIIFFLFHAHRGLGVAFQTNGTGHGYGDGYLGALLVCVLLGVFTMWGFDTAGSIGEETINPRKTSPHAIIRALVASGVFGALLLLTAAMAVKNSHDPNIASGGLAYVIQSVLGKTGGDVMLGCAAVAVFVCGLANQTGAVNMIFAMSRDNGLPAASRLARVGKRSRTPVIPPIIVAVVAVAILAFNIDQPSIFLVVSSTTVIFALFSYLLIAGSFAAVRLRGEWHQNDRRYFTLGRLGLPVSLAAAGWAVFTIVDIAWPRNAIYNPASPFHWYLKWGGVLFPVVLLLISFALYWFKQRGGIGILPEHAAERAAAPDLPTGTALPGRAAASAVLDPTP
ncbi:MAG: amino acid permease [Solirubrobacterales bacterium]|nr:amino acid permease [Solirubrobacterales bacterium]